MLGESNVVKLINTIFVGFLAAERRVFIRKVGYRDKLIGFAPYLRLGYSKCLTSLADKIFVAQKKEIVVYENKYPYHALEPILFGDVGSPVSMTSCNIKKCLYITFSKSFQIFKVEPELDNRVSQWRIQTDALFKGLSVTSNGGVLLVIETESEDDMLLLFTPEGTIKRAISLEYPIVQIKLIQEIMPDIVALSYAVNCIAIMRLDDNGTILRKIEWHEEIFDLTSFRYGDLLIVSRHEHGAWRRNFLASVNFDKCQIDSLLENDEFLKEERGRVQLIHGPFESKVVRALLTTDERMECIHFAADRKQLHVLFSKKLQIYELSYEDENCCQ